MLVDPNGTDAIFLTNETAVNTRKKIGSGKDIYLGHTAVIAQNSNGEWYYFSWGQDYADFIKVDDWALNSLDNFNNWLGMYKYDYTTSTYIGGDFSESVNYFQDLASTYVNEKGEKLARGTTNNEYDAFSNNCLQVVYEGLNKGILSDEKTKFKSYVNTKGARIPNIEKSIIATLFYNKAFTYDEYHKSINDQLWEAQNGANKSWFTARNLKKIIK